MASDSESAVDEAQKLGIRVKELEGEPLNSVWAIRRLEDIKAQFLRELRALEMYQKAKKFPSSALPQEYVTSLQASLEDLDISELQ
jgi:hypothetical protein